MILFFIVDSASPYPTEKEAKLWWDVNNRSRYAYVWRHHFSHHPSPQPLMYGTRTYGKYILQNKTWGLIISVGAWSNPIKPEAYLVLAIRFKSTDIVCYNIINGQISWSLNQLFLINRIPVLFYDWKYIAVEDCFF